MGVETTLTCKGCGKWVKTDAVRPEEWPRGWNTGSDGNLFHSVKCRMAYERERRARAALVTNANIIREGASKKLVELAGQVLKNSYSKTGPKCDLAFLVLSLFNK
jgi:hypothetical protein